MVIDAETRAIVPAKPAPVDSAITARRPAIRVPSSARLRSTIWPAVGSALIWAARDLLPEVIAAWQTPREDTTSSHVLRRGDAGVRSMAQRRRRCLGEQRPGGRRRYRRGRG